MAKLNTPRPFVKWAGGKTQLTTELLNRAPVSFKKYLEPFVGGGALFFALYREKRIKKAFLADLNEELIDAYKIIRDDVDSLIEELSTYPHKKDFFYAIRKKNPAQLSLVEKSARLIYLNKTCYNGLYRVNRHGQFNVPFGSYKSPKICDEENLRQVSEALRGVNIQCLSFEHVLKKARKGDFVYFDPPYQPVSKTANFTAYQPDGFNQNAQKQLQGVCHKLHKRDIKFMLSNSSTNLIHDLYETNGFTITKVKANRAINSNPKKRGKLTEVIITNYQVENGV